ncbi:unnamed protein product [Alopecurus aequalis]
MAKTSMATLQLSCIQIATAFLLFTQVKSTTETFSLHPNGTLTRCITAERSALLTFKAGLSDPASLLSSWKGDDCCRYKGVYCSNRTGHVIRLDLGGPDCKSRSARTHVQVLSGKISSSLLGLHHLRYLDLSCNRFDKIHIPEFMGSLQKLRYLDLAKSLFIGRIPPQLGNLSNLRYLNLGFYRYWPSDDSFHNGMYSTDITWLSRLTSLEHLDMSFVNISTVVQWLPVVNMLQTLKVLRLPFCQLTSSPDSLPLSNLTSLETLDLSFNNFHIHIKPNWFWDLTSLKYLDITSNGFHGQFPDEIGMTKTRDNTEDLKNAFTYGDSFGANDLVDYTENFIVLTKGQERLYTGEIIYMVNLDLSCNSLTGEIPTEISALVQLKSLNLSWNNFNRKVPDNIGALVQVESLDLSHNVLSGEIPSSLSDLTSLSRLNLSYNNLSGRIPSGNQLQALEDPAFIYIGNTGLCGPPLLRKCSSQPEPIPEHHEDASDGMVLSFLPTASGYVVGLWVVFCTFLFKRKWIVSWYSLCDCLYNCFYVQVDVTWASLRVKING